MQTLQFKTNIKCTGCVAKAAPYLNETAGEAAWSFEINSPEKVLTVSSAKTASAEDIVQAMEKAGYKATLL